MNRSGRKEVTERRNSNTRNRNGRKLDKGHNKLAEEKIQKVDKLVEQRAREVEEIVQ